MGLFDIFKKKPVEEPVNNPNSVFTLRFTIPYFQIFDKTDPELSALPIKMGASGSCQYRISDPELCFDNIPLKKMSPEKLETHVKDALSMNIKSYFNSLTSIPVLQFESMIDTISDAMKDRITPVLNDEFGINLRTFHISGVRYDTEDENYQRLQTVSQKKMEHRAKKVDKESEIELDELKHESNLRKRERESHQDMEIESRQHDLEMERSRKELELNQQTALKKHELDLKKKKEEKELELNLKGRQNSQDTAKNLSDLLGKIKD